MNMKLRYRLFLRRKSVYYAFDDQTKTFTSLKTKDKAEANRLLMAMNEAGKQPAMNLSLARVYLRHSDPMVTTRTWQNVLDEIIAIKSGPTQARWKSAAKDKAFDLIRNRVLIETQAEHLLAVLRSGTVSTNAFLRKIHNFAVDMNWLPATVIPRRQWPPIHYKEKRAITLEEHQRVIAAEVNPETKQTDFVKHCAKPLTNSVLEAHRLNSIYIKRAEGGKLHLVLANEIQPEENRPLQIKRVAESLLKYDANSLIHGVFLETIDGRARIPRALTGFIEAEGVETAASGGVKNDRIDPTGTMKLPETLKGVETKGDEGRQGNVPFHREEFTGKITAFFNLDLALIRGFGLGADVETLLVTIALFKIQKFLRDGLRLRTACDLETVIAVTALATPSRSRSQNRLTARLH